MKIKKNDKVEGNYFGSSYTGTVESVRTDSIDKSLVYVGVNLDCDLIRDNGYKAYSKGELFIVTLGTDVNKTIKLSR